MIDSVGLCYAKISSLFFFCASPPDRPRSFLTTVHDASHVSASIGIGEIRELPEPSIRCRDERHVREPCHFVRLLERAWTQTLLKTKSPKSVPRAPLRITRDAQAATPRPVQSILWVQDQTIDTQGRCRRRQTRHTPVPRLSERSRWKQKRGCERSRYLKAAR